MEHEFRQPRDYFRQKYFEACDILIGELSDRFEQEDVMKPVLCMESILLKSACGEKCNSELKSFSESVFQADFSIPQLEKQLAILVDVICVELPDVKRVTNIRTICTAMEAHRNRSMLSEVHKLLRFLLTIPVTSSTSERSFSAMRRLYTYLRSSMTESRFNNCFILHVHKELAERINLEDVAKEFISRNDERVRYFGAAPPNIDTLRRA